VFTNGRQAETFLALMADERALVVPSITIFNIADVDWLDATA
jgi:hypothetical protein